jgi:hypothetical protein
LPSSSTTTVDAPVSFQVNARDRYGNIATSENRNVKLSVVGNAVGSPVFLQSGTDVLAITSGSGTFVVSVTVAQQLSVTLLNSTSGVLVDTQVLTVKNGELY